MHDSKDERSHAIFLATVGVDAAVFKQNVWQCENKVLGELEVMAYHRAPSPCRGESTLFKKRV